MKLLLNRGGQVQTVCEPVREVAQRRSVEAVVHLVNQQVRGLVVEFFQLRNQLLETLERAENHPPVVRFHFCTNEFQIRRAFAIHQNDVVVREEGAKPRLQLAHREEQRRDAHDMIRIRARQHVACDHRLPRPRGQTQQGFGGLGVREHVVERGLLIRSQGQQRLVDRRGGTGNNSRPVFVCAVRQYDVLDLAVRRQNVLLQVHLQLGVRRVQVPRGFETTKHAIDEARAFARGQSTRSTCS